MKRFVLTVVVLILAGAIGTGIAAPLPTYTIQRAIGPITVDGILDEPDWEAATPAGDFVFPWWTEGEREQTLARMLWDDTNLYVSFVCQDAHIWAEYTNRDEPVYRDDAVEIFVSPDPDNVTNNYNFEINCTAVLYDQSRIPNNNSDKSWDAVGVQLQSRIVGTLNDDSDVDEGWTMEVSIPFSNFSPLAAHTPPEDGDEWRINLNRCGGKTNPQYSQWSSSETAKPNFHVPERFGIVYFSSEPVASPTPVSFQGWGVLKRRWFDGGNSSYELRVTSYGLREMPDIETRNP